MTSHLSLDRAITDFIRDLRGEHAKKTLATYSEAASQYAAYATSQGITTVDAITRRSIREWLNTLRDAGRKPSTVANRDAGLRAFLKWCVAERVLDENPSIGLPRPAADAPLIPILSPEQLGAILRACRGTSFEDIRDTALLKLMMDTGMRNEECATLTTDDLDLDNDVAIVIGKGNRPRACPFGFETSRALRRYQRERDAHRHRRLPNLWIGQRGAYLAAPRYVLARRARLAGITDRIFPHMLRHTWAHEAMQRMQEGDIMRLGGWRDRAMLSRYAASGADERAQRAYREHSLVDRLR